MDIYARISVREYLSMDIYACKSMHGYACMDIRAWVFTHGYFMHGYPYRDIYA